VRIVLILNREYPLPAQINAAGHLSVGVHKLMSNADLSMRQFRDRDGDAASVLTDLPLIVLEVGNSAALQGIFAKAKSLGLPASAFFDCMRRGSIEEQEAHVRECPIEDQTFIGIILGGSKEALKPVTGRLRSYQDFSSIPTFDVA
jgi:hypothetical protein